MKKICLVTHQPFWLQSLGSATLLRNRYRLLRNSADEVFVLFLAGKNKFPMPLGGWVINYESLDLATVKQVSSFIERQNFHSVYFSYNLFNELAARLSCNKVVEIHDVLHLRQASFAKFGFEAPISQSKASELESLAQYQAIVCLNSAECNYLSELGLNKVHFIPPNFERKSSRTPVGESVGLIGSAAKPNIDGINFYKLGILSSKSLVVAGAISSALGTYPVSPNVKDLGTVANLQDFYNEIGVSLIPVRFGGGGKIKAVEAIAFGRPIFSTSHGVEGLPTGIECAAIVENSPEGWKWERFLSALQTDTSNIEDYFNENFSDAACEKAFASLFE